MNRPSKDTAVGSRLARAPLDASQAQLFREGQKILARNPENGQLYEKLCRAGCDQRELLIALVQAAYAEVCECQSVKGPRGKRRPALTFERFLLPDFTGDTRAKERTLRDMPRRIRELAVDFRKIQRSVYRIPAYVEFVCSPSGSALPVAVIPEVFDLCGRLLTITIKPSKSSERVKHTFLARGNLVRLVAEHVAPLPYEDLSKLINLVVSALLDCSIEVITAKGLEQAYRRYKNRH